MKETTRSEAWRARVEQVPELQRRRTLKSKKTTAARRLATTTRG